MEQVKLKSIIQAEIHNAIGYVMTETIYDRQKALEYYIGQPYGNEVEGRSSIVTKEVAEVIDGAIPQIIRVFSASDDVVKFEPVREGDEPFADQATTLANHVFYKDNDGFIILHNWFKDALLEKNGVVKAYWQDKIDVNYEKYANLTDDELTYLLQDPETEVVSQNTKEVIVADEMTGMETKTVSHDVKLRKKINLGKVVVENVPPEEFLISKRARKIEDAPFCAQRRMVTRSDLIAMGFEAKVVDTLPTGDALQFSPERIARYTRGEQPLDMQSQDHTMQLIEVYECYIKVDQNDDGVAELRRVLYAGNTILSDEECDYVPFYSVCPSPIPHKFYGQGLADKVIDLQLTKSTILRQMLDNLYLTNNYRVAAVEGKVNLDDLLTSTAGGVIRVKDPSAIVPLTVQSTANQSFPMMDYLDQVQAKRTGVSDMNQGLDPNVLQNATATAVATMANAAQGKLELIARIFAETGVKSLFKGILHLLCKYQDKERTLRINGKFVAFNPREWHDQYEVTIHVGLGNGSKQEQLATTQMILGKQEQIIQQYGLSNPLVNLKQYRDTLAKFIHMAGFRDSSSFMNEIDDQKAAELAQQAAQQQPQPDPTIESTKILAQAQVTQAQIRAQSDQAKNQIEAEKLRLEAAKQQLEMQMEQFKLQVNTAAQGEKIRTDQAKMIVDSIDKISKLQGQYHG
jgi:hypothetical protein